MHQQFSNSTSLKKIKQCTPSYKHETRLYTRLIKKNFRNTLLIIVRPTFTINTVHILSVMESLSCQLAYMNTKFSREPPYCRQGVKHTNRMNIADTDAGCNNNNTGMCNRSIPAPRGVTIRNKPKPIVRFYFVFFLVAKSHACTHHQCELIVTTTKTTTQRPRPSEKITETFSK